MKKQFASLICLVLILSMTQAVHAKYSVKKLRQLAAQTAQRHGVDTSLVFAIIKQESGWKYKVVSHAGARGLMQIMPATAWGACRLKKSELFNPKKNLDCGVRYFLKQLKRFGKVKLALCAYNAGPGSIKKGRCPRYKETIGYMSNIMRMWGGKNQWRSKKIRSTQPKIRIVSAHTSTPTIPVKSYKSPCERNPAMCRSGRVPLPPKRDAEKSYCKYFPEDCRGSSLNYSLKMESIPYRRQDYKASSHSAYCNYFPEDCNRSSNNQTTKPRYKQSNGDYCDYFPMDCR